MLSCSISREGRHRVPIKATGRITNIGQETEGTKENMGKKQNKMYFFNSREWICQSIWFQIGSLEHFPVESGAQPFLHRTGVARVEEYGPGALAVIAT